ncbi:MAG: hypothetical protein IJW48_03880 [Clostridia bacterium]|nr:hypothetical protein [Clostridia bacterium]
MIEILYKDKNAVVINKLSGVPCESDQTGDADALTLTGEMLASLGEANTLYLVHRLDRVTGGVLAFARTRAAAAELSALFAAHRLTKQYLTVCDGETEEEARLSDLLFRDARSGRAYIVDRERGGVKRAELTYRRLARSECDGKVKSLLLVTLETGRFHQIRAQLSHRGTPVTGDGKYGSRDKGLRGIALHSARLVLPLSRGTVDVHSLPEMTAYPWSLFDVEKIKKELLR